MVPPTVISHKQAFIATQTRLLTRPLEPSPDWHDANEQAEEPLSERLLTDILFRLNQKLQQHEHRVHPQQATRHVAEQIDALYWNAAGQVAARDDPEEDDVPGSLSVYADLTNPEVIAELPPTWASEGEAAANPAEARRYEALVASLLAQSARRQQAAERVARLRALRTRLRPFDGDVQPNLATRGGGVEAELERQKLLLARVAGRIDQLPDADAENVEDAPAENGEDGDEMLVDDAFVDEQVRAYQLLNRF